MGAWRQDDEIVEQTIRSLRKTRLRLPMEAGEGALGDRPSTFIPDFLSGPNVPVDLARRHDLFVQYVNVLAPTTVFTLPQTTISHALIVSIMHLITMVFNDGREIECLPRGHLRHAEPDNVLFILRHLRAIPLQDMLFPSEGDQLLVNLVAIINDMTAQADPDEAKVITAGFKLLSILAPEDRETVLAQSIQIMEPIGLPFFKRVPIRIRDSDLTHYLVAQDVP